MTKKRPFLLLATGLILSLALGLSFWAGLQSEDDEPWAPLVSRLPMSVNGWRGEDVPLGETEAVRSAVEKLNYDDYIYRVYRKDGKEVFVYAMFWRQGSVSVREMAGHTPDGCWTAGGAKYCAPIERKGFTLGNQPTLAGEARAFAFPNGSRVNVVWWHLWGGKLVDRNYSDRNIMPMLRETWEWLVRNKGRKRDQLMVRIHGTDSLDQLVLTPPAAAFLTALPVLANANSASAR